MRWVSAGLCLASIAATIPASAPAAPKACSASFAKLLGPDVFRKYPAPLVGHIRPVPPIIAPDDRGYRTAIRQGAKAGPNFAGHYTIVEPGCGTDTVCPVIVDQLMGKVTFPSDFHAATSLSAYKNIGVKYVDGLNYKRGSRLLLVAGDLDDNEKRLGLSYYILDAGLLRLVRFIPAAEFCASH